MAKIRVTGMLGKICYDGVHQFARYDSRHHDHPIPVIIILFDRMHKLKLI